LLSLDCESIAENCGLLDLLGKLLDAAAATGFAFLKHHATLN
jgi:hypothetical protein